MAEDSRPGAVYWIDHYVIGTNDLDRSDDFYARVLGTEERRANGAPMLPEERARGRIRFLWVTDGFHFGTCLQPEPLPPTKGLGKAFPRYGYFVRQAEVADHVRRLDALNVPHTDPVRTSDEGQPGVAVYWEDPDGNQMEFWAPDRLPEGAMDGEGSLHVGRCSSVAFEARDLARSTDFYSTYCALDPIYSADIPSDTASFSLPGGGRLVLKEVDELGPRTVGHTGWRVLHTALAVREDEFMPAYRRMWDALPEWDFDITTETLLKEQAEALPARTGLHGDFDVPWKQALGRGMTFYDWDTNACHLHPGRPKDGSMAHYVGADIRAYYEKR